MHEPKILIVDDEEDVIQALRVRLETAGYQVLTASHGIDALATLREDDIELVLADFMMPKLDGLELTRLITQNPRWANVKIVLFSCNTDLKHREKAFELGALDYLSKMSGASSIVRRVYDLLGPGPESRDQPHGAMPAPPESALSQQLRTLAQEILDFVQQSRKSRELTPTTLRALAIAERLAEELGRAAVSADQDARQELQSSVLGAGTSDSSVT